MTKQDDRFLTLTTEEYRRRYGDRAPKPKRRRNKYGAVKVKFDGYTFDSKVEYYRYVYLKSELEAGRILHLEVHPPIEITDGFANNEGNWRKPRIYKADFMYWDCEDEVIVVEDVKGGKATQTQLFKLKWLLLEWKYQNEPKIRLRIIET